MTSRQLDEERIFHLARKLEDPGDRDDYLDQVCAGDLALRERVEALLEVHEKEQDFLKSSSEPAPTVDQSPVSEGPGTQIGRYKLLQKIGEGGFGVVYMAEQHRPVRRKVALKIIKPGMDTHAVVARFEAERQALALMDHPNISRVLDGGATDSGRPYFVMDLVRGVPITEYCDANNLPTHGRLELFTTVCQSVQHAHQKGIIHRDLKPSNILITLADGEPVVKVIDFGISKALNQQLTEKTLFTAYGQMIGTPQYMSPEQAEMSCLDVDTRSDIYSLGVLLYELLTGTTPMEGERLRTAGYAEMQRTIREEEPPKPSSRLSAAGEKLTAAAKHRSATPERLRRLVRGDLDWIVMKALEKERGRRYDTANAFSSDVRRFLIEEPIEARPPSAIYRLRKTAARHRGLAWASLATSLALIVGTVFSSWMALRASQSARMALSKQLEAEHERRLTKAAQEELQVTSDLLRRTLHEFWDQLAAVALDKAFSGDFDQAEKAIRKAELAGAPQDLTETLRGISMFFTGRTDEAIEHLKSVVATKPDSTIALSGLFWAYRHTAQYRQMSAVKERLANVGLEDPTPFERLFQSLTRAIGGSKRSIDGAIRQLDSLIEQQDTWGVAYAVRATARLHLALESKSKDLKTLEAAVEDFVRAREQLPNSPFVYSIGLEVLTQAIALGEYHEEDTATWRSEAEQAAKMLEKWPHYLDGRAWRVSYYKLTGQTGLATDEENALEEVKIGQGLQALLEDDAIDVLSSDDTDPLNLLCRGIAFTQTGGDGIEEAKQLFRQLQQRKTILPFRVFSLDIPLLLGDLDTANRASKPCDCKRD